MAQVPVPDGVVPIYWAAPEGEGPWPVVLVVQEIFGLHEHIQDVVRRLAHAGYFAVAPALFWRLGDPGQASSVDEILGQFVRPTPDASVMADLDAVVAWADGRGGHTGQLLVTGFCWGGRITWLYVAHQPRVTAGVAWYGKVAAPSTPLQPSQPMDVVENLHAPVLGLYAGQDAGIPLEGVTRLGHSLQASGNTAAQASRMHVYPDASHAFFADYRPSYRAADASDGWQRMLAWFRQATTS